MPTIRIADDIPVVTLARALAEAGLCLRPTPRGQLSIEWSPEFREHGVTSHGHVPTFLRASNPNVPLPQAVKAQLAGETPT